MKKKAFSLAELLITLIIVSCILAAFAPVITKRMSNGGINIGGGGGTIEKTIVESNVTVDGMTDDCENSDCKLCIGNACLICDLTCPEGISRDYMHCTCVNCAERGFDENCAQCSQTECKMCKNGYILNSSKGCDSCETLGPDKWCNGKNVETCPVGYECSGGRGTKCPVNTYSRGGSTGCIACASNEYAEEGSKTCSACSKFSPKCLSCDPDGCNSCSTGYMVSGKGCAEDNSDILFYKGMYIYKYNAGDKGGPPIPDDVTVVKTGQNCSGKCCWQAGTYNTAASGCQQSFGTSYYSGCKRTVCNWSAADTICKSLGEGWKLPTLDETVFWNNINYNKGKDGLQLCDYYSGYGAIACPYTDSAATNCYGAYGNYCFPDRQWAAETTGSNAYYYYIQSGNLNTSNYQQTRAMSVRCMKVAEDWPQNCLRVAGDGECSECEQGYKMKNGKCVYNLETDLAVLRFNGLKITKFNAGDQNGPPIPSAVKVVLTGTSCSGYCCWQAGRTNTAASGCESSYGTSSYSGCKRTVCNYNAANAICADITDENGNKGSWRLPNLAETSDWNLVNYNKGKEGLQLCDYYKGYGAIACPYTDSAATNCYGAYGNYCFPDRQWAAETTGSNAYYYYVQNGNANTSEYQQTRAMSVRCVRDDYDFPENCMLASPEGKCTQCKTGFKLVNGKCVYNLETEDTILNYNGLKITKFNAGDEGGPAIPSNVQVVYTGSYCSGNCCWKASKANTAASGCGITFGTSTYSGCKRTVCNWGAANAICSEMPDENGNKGSWRLPNLAETNNWFHMNYQKGKDGLQLCDYYSGYGAIACPYTDAAATNCYGAYSNYCFPDRNWAAETNGANAYYYYIQSGVAGSSEYQQTRAMSVRCVKDDPEFPKNCVIADSSGKCTQCKTGYTVQNGVCKYILETDEASLRYDGLIITRFNAGDNYGPPISSNVRVVSVGTSCSGNCCWQALVKNTSDSSCQATFGTSTYSGCKRTVCNWNAASDICASIPDENGIPGTWRLPTLAEMITWNYINYNKAADGLQLCDYYSGYGAAACPYTAANDTSFCNGANGAYCMPDRAWSSDVSGSNAYYFYLQYGIAYTSNQAATRTGTVRCVKDIPNFPTGCLIADENNKCTQCKSGYSLSGGACTIHMDTLTHNGLEITKFNAGDESGPPIPFGVDLVTTGQSCSGFCCWRAHIKNTANTNCTATADSSKYSGCKRTVCNWNAANAICAAIPDENGVIGKWRLPTTAELTDIGANLATLNTGKGADGLQLCDYNKGYGTTACPYTDASDTSRCNGANGSYCFPDRLWASEIDGANAYYFYLQSGVPYTSTQSAARANSVRCVRDL